MEGERGERNNRKRVEASPKNEEPKAVIECEGRVEGAREEEMGGDLTREGATRIPESGECEVTNIRYDIPIELWRGMKVTARIRKCVFPDGNVAYSWTIKIKDKKEQPKDPVVVRTEIEGVSDSERGARKDLTDQLERMITPAQKKGKNKTKEITLEPSIKIRKKRVTYMFPRDEQNPFSGLRFDFDMVTFVGWRTEKGKWEEKEVLPPLAILEIESSIEESGYSVNEVERIVEAAKYFGLTLHTLSAKDILKREGYIK